MGVGPVPGHREGAGQGRAEHRRHRRVRDQRGLRRPGAGLPRPLRHRRRRPRGQPVRRRDRARPPAGQLRGAADDPPGPRLPRAPGGALRPHHDVHRARHGRHRHLGEPAPHRPATERGGDEHGAIEPTSGWLARGRPRPPTPARWSPARSAATSCCPTPAGPAVLITLDNGQDHRRPNTLGPAGWASSNRGPGRRPGPRRRGGDRRSPASRSSWPPAPTSAASRDHRARAGAGRSPGSATPSSTSCTRAPVPTFAFINGLALGGGLEVALHCHYRTVSAAAAGIALPECFLGMFPGWGGAYLLPNLIGADRAVTGDHREPAEPEPDADRSAGVRARAGRRDVRRRRLPGALAGLGRTRRRRRTIVVDAAGDRPRPGLGRRARARQGARRRKGLRRVARAVPGAGPDRRGPDRRPGRARTRPRTRAWPT